MAIEALKLFGKYGGKHRLSQKQAAEVMQVATCTPTSEDSKRIGQYKGPMVIISASGMATGGRVLHHLKQFAPDARNTILFAGYQASGTRGAKLLDGLGEIKIHGEIFPVRAQVEQLSSISAHADYQEILDWLANFASPPKKVFITHGEPVSARALQRKITARLKWKCYIPRYLDTERL